MGEKADIMMMSYVMLLCNWRSGAKLVLNMTRKDFVFDRLVSRYLRDISIIQLQNYSTY